MGKSRMRRFRAYNTGNEEDEERISTCLSRNGMLRTFSTFNSFSLSVQFHLRIIGNGVKLSKFASYVNILKEDEFSLAWVTTYEVHYRHTVTNKWTLLCVTSANSDAFSEQVLDLRPYFNAKDGLLTQYLRIRPLEYIHQPKMRVSVYGIDPQYNCGINGSIVKGITTARASGDRSAAGRQTLVEAGRIGEGKEEGDDEGEYSTLGAEDVPTIEYAVAHGVSADNRKYVRDALSTGRYWDRYGQGKNPKHLKNSRNRNFIREEHREYYKNFD